MEVDCMQSTALEAAFSVDVLILVVMEVDCICLRRGNLQGNKRVLILVVMEVDCIANADGSSAEGDCLNPCCDGSRLYILTINMLL